MKPLSNIINQNSDFVKMFNESETAGDHYKPVPHGEYQGSLERIEFRESRLGTKGVTLVFMIVGDSDYAGKRLYLDEWFTVAAMPYVKRDLLKIGITNLSDLDKPLPRHLCKLNVVVHVDDEGNERNKIKYFEVVGLHECKSDPFAQEEDSPDAGADIDIEEMLS